MALTGGTGSRLRNAAGHGSSGGHDGAGGMRWLLTYADMITLLLALFIILFAISTISKVKLQRLATEISGGFSSIDSNNQPPSGRKTNAEQESSEQANMAKIEAQLDEYVAKEHLESKVQIRQDRAGLVITLLSDRAYYSSGSAELRPETKNLLDVVAAQLRGVRNAVRVEGNTDNIPIATSQFPTNWELSAARATGVTRYLVERDRIAPTRLSFAGYGEFRPKFANDSEAHRQQNRRVDIVILNGTDQQPGDEPTAVKSTPDRNLVARSDGGAHAQRGGRAVSGAPSK